MDRHMLWKQIDVYKRKLFLKSEIKRLLLKSLKRSKVTSFTRRNLASFLLTNLPKLTSQTTSNNRCYISGRSFGVNRKTRTSRFLIRNKIYHSEIPGFRRASW